MIKELNNSYVEVARQIFKVFQRSYSVEAQLIGTLDFPPLKRSVNNIKESHTKFYGFFTNDTIVAVIEFSIRDRHLSICSLTVDPDHFNKGIANQLISYVLNIKGITTATVETAVVNMPAISLYKKLGFIEYKRWIPSHGIEKLAMTVECATWNSHKN